MKGSVGCTQLQRAQGLAMNRINRLRVMCKPSPSHYNDVVTGSH